MVGMRKRALSVEAFQERLEPGDILLTSAKPSRDRNPLIRAWDKAFSATSHALQGDHTHSLIYVGDGDAVETRMGVGVKQLPLRRALSTISKTRAFRAAELTPEERQAAAERAKELVKTQPAYAFKTLTRALVERVAGLKLPVPKADGLICSNLVREAYGPHRIVTKARDLTLPMDFAKSKRLKVVADLNRRVRD